MDRETPKGYFKKCGHCGEGYDYFPDLDPEVANTYCGPDCANCAETRRMEFWAAPCREHKEVAEKRNERFIANNPPASLSGESE